jgi:3-polyprenyl-4-hydroxybenzoate decarboxylase
MNPEERKDALPDGAQLAIAKAIPCAKSTVSKVIDGKAKRMTKLTHSIVIRASKRLGLPVREVFPEYYRGKAA